MKSILILLWTITLFAARPLVAQNAEADDHGPPASGCPKLSSGSSAEDVKDSMSCFESILSAKPEDVSARTGEVDAGAQQALRERRAGRPDLALAFLTRAKGFVPNDPQLLLYVGIQAHSMGLFHDAEESLRYALKLRPSDGPTIYALARVELDLDKLPDAEIMFRDYLRMNPDDASAHFGLGRMLYKALRTDEARTEFQRAIELQPVQTESFYELGQIALDLHQDEEAHRNFQTALARDPKHGGALTGEGILAYRTKDFQKAKRNLEAAIQSSPKYQTAHYYLGLTLSKLGESVDADSEFRLATMLAHDQEMAKHQGQRLAGILAP